MAAPYSASGREKYRHTIHKDGEWRVGSDHAYRVVSPAEEADPFRKLLRLVNLPVVILHRHKVGEAVELEGIWAHLHCNIVNRMSSRLQTDSQELVSWGKMIYGPGSYQERSWSARISSATYVVVQEERSNSIGSVYKGVREFHIWGNPEVEPAAKIIHEWLRGADAKPK